MSSIREHLMHPSLTCSQRTKPGPGSLLCSSPTAGPDSTYPQLGGGPLSPCWPQLPGAAQFSKLNLPSRPNSLVPFPPWNLSRRESLSICPLSPGAKAQLGRPFSTFSTRVRTAPCLSRPSTGPGSEHPMPQPFWLLTPESDPRPTPPRLLTHTYKYSPFLFIPDLCRAAWSLEGQNQPWKFRKLNGRGHSVGAWLLAEVVTLNRGC